MLYKNVFLVTLISGTIIQAAGPERRHYQRAARELRFNPIARPAAQNHNIVPAADALEQADPLMVEVNRPQPGDALRRMAARRLREIHQMNNMMAFRPDQMDRPPVARRLGPEFMASIITEFTPQNSVHNTPRAGSPA